ncbi:MAG: GNAT family N-acetyltransferase [Thermoleophilaceae bacterium]
MCRVGLPAGQRVFGLSDSQGSAAGLSLRQAAPGDATAIAALWTEAYVGVPGGGRDHPYGDDDVRESSRAGEVIVAERGAELVGVVVLMGSDADLARVARDEELEVARLAVRKRTRRAGVARRLMKRCHEQSDRAGQATVLWTRPVQRAAQRLYESLGYERRPGRDFGDDFSACLVYRRALAPGAAKVRR